jgi:DNA-binding SARP family transcriptional activator
MRLLGGFAVADGDAVISLPTDARRVLALLALEGPSLPRAVVAGVLWLESSQEHANGSLRSALWRLRRHTDQLIHADTRMISLHPSVTTDITTVTSTARRFCSPDARISIDDQIDIEPFTQELLPGWYDEWTIVERERLRQLSLHALEAIARCLADRHRFAEAIDAAIAAIGLDPLRETAHHTLISLHIAEGNPSEALRHYHTYRTLLHTELGLQPSLDLTQLALHATRRQRSGDGAAR